MKIMITILFLNGFCLCAQTQKANWQNLDLKADSVFGISAEKAYRELRLPKRRKPVLVAVIDSGIDTAHEDLKANLWINKKENRINSRDDDHNGYVDDRYGWNFIGSGQGSNVQYDNLELTRTIRELQQAHDTLGVYRALIKTYREELAKAQKSLNSFQGFDSLMQSVLTAIHTLHPTLADLQAFQPKNSGEAHVKNVLFYQLQQGTDLGAFEKEQIQGGVRHYREMLDYHLNSHFDPRNIVGDDYANSSQRNYGNRDVTGPDALHGTHVAGIIGAIRDNSIGIQGVADHVRIMAVRAVPDGDERDKDVANAIRYAVDNGARVINMSFGKPWSHDKKAVDAAVQYACAKDVLLIAAAGNDAKDLDTVNSFPNPVYEDGSGTAAGWITVGASGEKDDSTLVAPFSNYGKTKVDVFAPGVDIYSTVPGSQYKQESGTSMAAPVVTGLATLIRAHYPRLRAVQVKEIIMKSVVTRDILKDKCVSGGVVNAYNALQLAATYK